MLRKVFLKVCEGMEEDSREKKTCYELLGFCGSIIEVCERSEWKLKKKVVTI